MSKINENRNIILLILIVILLIVAVGLVVNIISGGGINISASSTGEEELSLLFVIRGDASVTDDSLNITPDLVEWFTDRPHHQAGPLDATTLVELWDSAYATSPPNAAITGDNLNAVVVLDNLSQSSNTISFKYTLISGNLNQGNLGDVSIFVDRIGEPTNFCILSVTVNLPQGSVSGTATSNLSQIDCTNAQNVFSSAGVQWEVPACSYINNANLITDLSSECNETKIQNMSISSTSGDWSCSATSTLTSVVSNDQKQLTMTYSKMSITCTNPSNGQAIGINVPDATFTDTT